jgi:hypothetical protein
MSITEQLIKTLHESKSGPFLFIGSGLSRRYLGLEDWKGLLARFTPEGKPFEYYLSMADGDIPKATSLLAEDFNQIWWSSSTYQESVERNKHKAVGKCSALRIEISNYINKLNYSGVIRDNYKDEVDLLSALNVDGVITTNWDRFAEHLFPDSKVYIGQDELLFANPQQIGEIYKIHGCSSRPESLVLTDRDYANFRDKQPYLTSKLITIFVEHPVVFLGYSLSDPNIGQLLESIASCVGSQHLEKLRKNLIFVSRLKSGEREQISETYQVVNGVQLPIVLVKTDSFIDVFHAINTVKRKIPTRVLRYFKEEFYELVKTNDPKAKLYVADIDSLNNKDEIEFVVGVGVAETKREEERQGVPSAVGYSTLTVNDLIDDLLNDKGSFSSESIVNDVVPFLLKSTANVPVFKYLSAMGISSLSDYERHGLHVDKVVKRSLDKFGIKTVKKLYFKQRKKSLSELIDANPPQNAAKLIVFLPKSKVDLSVLHRFLLDNIDKMESSQYASDFKKLAAFYDRLRYGWD